MKHSLIILINMILITSATCQQAPENRPHCQDPEFDKEVNSYLSYSIPVIGVSELAETTDNYLLLDARELEEYRTSHIPGAEHVGYDNPDWHKLANVDKNTPIVLYCSIGYRSEKMGEALREKGFTEVYNLYGSIFEWANQGHRLEGQKEETTSRIHTYNKKWSRWVLNPELEKIW